MQFTVGPAALGTSEDEWNRDAWLSSLAPLALKDAVGGAVGGSGTRRHCVVVAPHPDDETLGAGGALVMLKALGFSFTVVAVTDGEGSHPRSLTVPAAALIERRAAERDHALACLGLRDAAALGGVDASEVVRLGIPDGMVHPTEALTERLRGLLRGAGLCLAPFVGDGHPDHDSAGKAALRACLAAGVPLFEYLVWAWHWGKPASPEIPWARARRLALTPEAQAAKARAILSYRSQIEPLSGAPPAPGDEPVLPPAVLARFRRPCEVFLV